MTINIPGCKTVDWTDDEQAMAQELSDIYSRVAEIRLSMPRGSLLVEFTKAVAVDVTEKPPVLFRNYRGDFKQKTEELLAEML